ncbi:3-hydroxyacyl-CoA dehydrogenase family protein [Aerococcus suis]
MQLLATGVATPRDIDLAWKVGRNIPYGPCQAIDRVGIRTLYNIYLAHYANTGLEADEKALALLERLEKAGELGQETGMGLYEYRDGETIDREWNL